MSARDFMMLFCKDILPRIAGIVLMILFGVISFYQFRLCGEAGNPQSAVFRFLFGVALVSAASLLLVRFCLPVAAKHFAFGLLFPRKYLKEVPILLSPVQGQIAAGHFCEAEEQLIRLRREHPGNAQIVLLLLHLYEDRLGQHQAAVETVEIYLDSGAAQPGPDHFRLLLRYADFLQGTEREKELEERLQTEIKHRRLTASESAAVHARIAALHQNRPGGKA